VPRNLVVLLDNPEGRTLVKEACKRYGIGFPELEELIQAEVVQTGKQRRAGLWDDFDDILDRIQPDESH
jgi:hypothetical protein